MSCQVIRCDLLAGVSAGAVLLSVLCVTRVAEAQLDTPRVVLPAHADATPDAGVPASTEPRDDGARPPVFSARARAVSTDDPGRHRLSLAETRDLPGAFGDPFRAVEVLPGLVPVASGLPYFYVRGWNSVRLRRPPDADALSPRFRPERAR